MATTSPDEIYSPEQNTKTGLVVALKSMADSIQRAFNRRTGAGTAWRSSDIAVPSNTSLSISPLSDAYTTGNVSFSANSFTVKVAGYYQMNAMVAFEPNANGYRAVSICVNGQDRGYSYIMRGFDGHLERTAVSTIQILNANDVVTVQRWQNSGTALLERNSLFSIGLVSPL